jgi:hypothetical protein
MRPCVLHGNERRRALLRSSMPTAPGWRAPSHKECVRAECGARATRGLAKTHLDHVLTATALNCLRLSEWMAGAPKATTQHSRFARLLAFSS